MLHDGIEPIDDDGDDLLIPHQEAAITGIGIEHETHPYIVAFALHTIDASPLTPEAYPFRLAHARAGSPLDTLWLPMSEPSCCRCGWRSRSIVPLWQTHGVRIRKSGTACADVRTPVLARPFWCEEWHVQPGLGRISAHRSHAPIGFSQQRVIQTPGRFQVGTERLFIAPIEL